MSTALTNTEKRQNNEARIEKMTEAIHQAVIEFLADNPYTGQNGEEWISETTELMTTKAVKSACDKWDSQADHFNQEMEDTVEFTNSGKVTLKTVEPKLVVGENYHLHNEFSSWKYGGLGRHGYRFVRVGIDGDLFNPTEDVREFNTIAEAEAAVIFAEAMGGPEWL